MNKEWVVLQQLDGPGRAWSLTAGLNPDGDLVLQGYDRSADLAEMFGGEVREYEYVYTVRAGDLPSLLQALDAGSELFPALLARFGRPESLPVQAFLEENGIVYEFWSRMGD